MKVGRVDGGAVNPKKTSMRHASDLAFHLANAARSAKQIERVADSRASGKALQIKEIAMKLRREALNLERELTR